MDEAEMENIDYFHENTNDSDLSEFDPIENECMQDEQNECIYDESIQCVQGKYMQEECIQNVRDKPMQNKLCTLDNSLPDESLQKEYIENASSANYSYEAEMENIYYFHETTNNSDLSEFDPIKNECMQDEQNECIYDECIQSVQGKYMQEECIQNVRDKSMQNKCILDNSLPDEPLQKEYIENASSANYSCEYSLNKSEKSKSLEYTLDNVETDDSEGLEAILKSIDSLNNSDLYEEMINLSKEADESYVDEMDGSRVQNDSKLASLPNNSRVRFSTDVDLPQQTKSSTGNLFSPDTSDHETTSYDNDTHQSIDSASSDASLLKATDLDVDQNLSLLRGNLSYNEYSLSPIILKKKNSIVLDEPVLYEENSRNHQNRKRKRLNVIDSDDDSYQEFNTDGLNALQRGSSRRKTYDYSDSESQISDSYIPSDKSLEEEDSNSEDSFGDDIDDMIPIKKKTNNSYECAKNESISDEEFLKSLYVPESSEGGKYYTKESCCPYCLKVVIRLDQHLLKVHSDKEAVKKIINLPKNSKERRREFTILRMHGNARHNEDPAINKTGKLLVMRRLASNLGKKKKVSSNDEASTDSQSDNESGEDHLIKRMKNHNLAGSEKEKSESCEQPTIKLSRIQCTLCPAYVSRRNISLHYKNWHTTDAEKKSNTRAILKECRSQNEFVHPLACERVKREILASLRVNEIFELIRYDKTIIIYLNNICDRYDIKDQDKLIKTHARTLGQFLRAMKTLNPNIKDLESCISSEHWDNTIKAVRMIAKFDDKKRTFQSPSTAQLLGLILKHVIGVLKSYYNRQHDRNGFRNVRSFEIEFGSHWTNSIGSKIVSSQNIIKRHDLGKTISAMSTNDKNILIEFLDSRRHVLFADLKKKFTQNIYDELMKCEMIYLQSANARRPCEIDRATRTDYDCKKSASPENEHSKKLNPKDQQRLKDYLFMDTKGKKLHGLDGRIYLKKLDIKIMDYLINYRSKVGISKGNPYLFAVPAKNNSTNAQHLDAHYTMKKLVDICYSKYKQFENRDTITATGLRKYAATKYKTTANGGHSEFLLRHLAHTKQTHDAHYRAITAQETAIVTDILESVILSKESPDEQNNVESINETNEYSLSESDDSHDEISQQEKISKSKGDQKTKTRRSWGPEDINAFEMAFADEIKNKKYPSQKKIRNAMEKFPVLKSRGVGPITSRFQSLRNKS